MMLVLTIIKKIIIYLIYLGAILWKVRQEAEAKLLIDPVMS